MVFGCRWLEGVAEGRVVGLGGREGAKSRGYVQCP